MVWKPKKGRRGGSRGTIATNGQSTGSRQLRSCLKVGPNDKILVGELSSISRPSSSGQDSTNCSARDRSNNSGRSLLSIISGSGSSRSKDTPSSEDHIQGSGASHTSADDSAVSPRDATSKSSQHSPGNISGGGVPSEDKNVRFGTISIREHERVVGDNPSCSTGPPIGIGWRHTDTRVIPLDHYEDRRSYRRKRIVLTRSEREELLLDWGISFDDIIDSIRMNIRVKNQRRQTVTNLGKIEKLEEAFESAARKIKAILLRRRTGEKVWRLLEQAEVARKIHSHPTSNAEGERKIAITHPEGEPTKFETGKDDDRNQVSLPDFRQIPSEKRLLRSSSSLSDIDDLHTSISGFSLGNSTTASAREMERFYRELEMEMFGDLPLPDMVGETLEVAISIPEEERVYYDPPCSMAYQEPPSVTPSYARMLDESMELRVAGSPPETSPFMEIPDMKLYFQPRQPPSFVSEQDERERSILSHALKDGAALEFAAIQRVVSHSSDEDNAILSSQMPTPPAGLIFHDDPVMAIRLGHVPPPEVRLTSNSLGSADMEKVEQHRANLARAYLSQTVTAMEQRYLHPSLAPPVPPTNQFGMTYFPENNTHGYPHHDATGSSSAEHMGSPASGSQSSRSSSRSKKSKRRKDGPEIRHIPPYVKKSPTHWMEGHDDAEDGPGKYSPYCDPITISEDAGYVDRIRPSGPPMEPRPVYVAPQRYPVSFY